MIDNQIGLIEENSFVIVFDVGSCYVDKTNHKVAVTTTVPLPPQCRLGCENAAPKPGQYLCFPITLYSYY